MRSGLWGIAVAVAVVATSGYAVAQGGPAGATCDRELDSRAMSYITSIDLRRVRIVDEHKGLVSGLTMFRHPMPFNAFDLEAAHIFKISDDKIHEIEAMGFMLPLNSKNGWNPFLR